MRTRVVGAGLLGGVVLVFWTFLVNGLLGFQARIDMRPVRAERRVYEVLREEIVRPGRYICNPEIGAEGRFPADEPVFSILYGGMGHEAAGRLALTGLAVFLISPMIGAWMLSRASRRTLASYPRKVVFFAALGLLIALFANLREYGIGGYPFRDACLLAANVILAWTVAGLATAWLIRPGEVRAGERRGTSTTEA